MTTDATTSSDQLDLDGLAAWLREAVDPSIASVTATKLSGGHSSGAWRLHLDTPGGTRALVLKAPADEGLVHQRDVVREARILDGLHRSGGPVPGVVAVDPAGHALGRPSFVMEVVPGQGLQDADLGGYHDDAGLHAAGPDAQRATWESFYDALAALHTVPGPAVPAAALGGDGLVGVLGYWRAALVDAVAADVVPRQLAALDWLAAHLPDDAADAAAVCMGDARIANCLFDGTEAMALVDFEVAYLGNPKADVGYSCFFDELQRANAATPLPGVGTTDEAWARWSGATGRDIEDRAYWTAFGATVLCVTATRAMVAWGLAGPTLEADNPVVAAWESAIEAAR